jgi:hypothetical protein
LSRPIMLRPRRESLHSDGITDQKSLTDFRNKIRA